MHDHATLPATKKDHATQLVGNDAHHAPRAAATASEEASHSQAARPAAAMSGENRTWGFGIA